MNILEHSLLILKKNGIAFCKGIYVKDINSFFSYNFLDAKLNPDRNEFSEFYPEIPINSILSHCKDYTIIRKVLNKIVDFYSSYDKTKEKPIECGLAENLNKILEEIHNSDYSMWEKKYTLFLFRKAFEDIFKDEILEKGYCGVVLKTDYKIPPFLQEKLKNYKVLDLPEEWRNFFETLGIKSDKDVIPDYYEEKLSTSLTLDYGAELWDSQRIVVDACQNHLPADSGGNNIYLRFQTKDGVWHDYTEFEKYEDSDIKKIKISDDGRGYDFKSLGVFASAKEHEKSSGKWGEGLKMIVASAVRKGVKVELGSRNWTATPQIDTEVLNKGEVNEKEIQRLGFNVRISTDKEGTKREDELEKEQSYTSFIDPPSDLIKEFRNIRQNVLVFSDQKPIISLGDIDVISWCDNNLYVKNLLVPGEHQTKYSYHLKNFDIETRDRDAIKVESMRSQIRSVLERIDDERFIKMYLLEAKEYAKNPGKKNFLEFNTYFQIPSRTEKADLWIKAFQEYFGEDSTVRSVNSQDYEDALQAEHMGLDTITLPDSIAKTLESIEGRDGNKIKSYKEALEEAIKNSIPVAEEDLTEEEKALIEQLYSFNDILFLSEQTINKIEHIKIYDYPPDYLGKKTAGYARFGNTVNIYRKILSEGLEEAADVFFHEVGHAQTGAADSHAEFRNYQTALLAAVVTRGHTLLKPTEQIEPPKCKLEESIKGDKLQKGIRFSDFVKSIKKIFSFKQRNKIKNENEVGESK